MVSSESAIMVSKQVFEWESHRRCRYWACFFFTQDFQAILFEHVRLFSVVRIHISFSPTKINALSRLAVCLYAITRISISLRFFLLCLWCVKNKSESCASNRATHYGEWKKHIIFRSFWRGLLFFWVGHVYNSKLGEISKVIAKNFLSCDRFRFRATTVVIRK